MKKKVLIVTDIMSIGGVERVIVNTLNGIDYSKFDVTLFIMYKTQGEKININKIPKSVRIEYLFTKPIKGVYKRILYYVMVLFPHLMTNKITRKNDWDVIITTKDMFSYPISASKGYKIMWVHGGFEHFETEKPNMFINFKRWLQKCTYNKFDKIILLTNAAKERFCNKYNLKEKSYVLNNPINTIEIERLANEGVSDYEFEHCVNLVCSSRLSIEKGVDRLVNSCSKLIKEGYKFKLIILGDGPEKGKLNELILEEPLLAKNVSILGFKDNPYKYISKCDIYVSPSLTEGFSLSIAEAIVLGLAILSTDCKGSAEMIDNGRFGLLVDNSENGVYEGLKKMLSMPELIDYYKLKSKERKEYFSYEKNIKLLEDIINGM